MSRILLQLALAAAFVVGAGMGSGLMAQPSQAPQTDPVSLVRQFLASTDAAERAQLAARIASHRDYRPSRLSEWLHRGASFGEQPAGSQTLTVDVGGGELRQVTLVVPPGYRHDRPWPLVYALHPSGEPAASWAGQVQRLLGVRARDFVIASPEYKQNYIAARPPFVPEHPAILDAVARRVHVDADRVYALGYSKGGFGAWFVALYYPDRFAGVIAMAAGFDVAPADDGFWKLLVRNVSHLPVLNTWGERDPLMIRGLDEQPIETFAESNRRFQREVGGMGLPITNIEVVGGVHNQLLPPPEPVVAILSGRRKEDPKRLSHTFRHVHQASCYWLEGLTWVGDHWGDPGPAPSPGASGDSESRRIARTLEPLLGRLTGELDGQTIRVTRRHVGDVVIWFGDRTIDWDRPVTVEVDGKIAFTGQLTRDVGVAMARAGAMADFDALRFAGLRVNADGQVSVVTLATMPAPVWILAAGR